MTELLSNLVTRVSRRALDAVCHRRARRSARRCATSSGTVRSCSAAKSTKPATCAIICPRRGAVHRQADARRLRLGDGGHGEEEALAARLVGWTPTATTMPQRACARALDETLTVMRLGLTGTLRKTFATTNPIENMNGVRRIARNVKRWKDRGQDPTLGRTRHRRSAEWLPAREGSREHALSRRRSKACHRDRGAREEGRERTNPSRRHYTKFNRERGVPGTRQRSSSPRRPEALSRHLRREA